MALSERLKRFIQSALGDPELKDELVTAIDANTASASGDIQSDGSQAFAANQPMGGFKLTGLGAGSAAGNSVRYEQAILASGANAFSADQPMGSNKLTGLAAGSAAGHSVRYEQAILAAGSNAFSADQPMGSNKLTGLAAGSAAGHSVRYEQAILASGANAFGAAQSMGGFGLTSVLDPVSAQDAATKVYVDNKVLVYTSSASAGGAATEVMTLTGILATDTILAVSQSVKGANSLPLLGFNTLGNNALTAVWSADPGANAVIIVHVKR